MFSGYAKTGGGGGGCVSLVWWVNVCSRPFTSLVLRHGNDFPFLCPFVVVFLKYDKRETSTSQAGHRRGPGRDTPFASSIISSLSMEELRSYYQIPDNIDIELPDGPTKSTIGKENGAIYFTGEQLAAGLRFPISSLIKQFLHFSGAPLALIHPNFIRILTGCSVLNLLYQLDISLVEVYFIYTLKLANGGRLSLSAQSPRRQFVTGLPDSPKTEAKGVILVRGPWYETPGSPDLLFTLNRSMAFPGVFKLWDLYVVARLSYVFS